MTTPGARPQFRTARAFQSGYATEDVDAFLDEVFSALASGRQVPNIEAARFKTARGRAGYDMDEVDRFLDDLLAGLSGGEIAEPTAEEQARAQALREAMDPFRRDQP
ncbi:DivIVA domain-containing protein [Ornithinimicrobium ciconiae]|uniref:DivIVA domain-containing protein n=1 Tax=Ornithinimicrobium ciconiae TaxID=2594265 RepID=UPI0013FD0D84|nr:DivIVA domain-containing protein [Ornithinimicrobium ciconiae]